MNTALQTFQFQSHQLTVISGEHGEPWFIAKEVAEILEYSDAFKMTSKLDDDEVQNRQIGGFGNRGVNIINESGLYASILTSKKPAAKVFKKWVTSEVLPSIHKTGGYTVQPSIPHRDYAELQAKHDSLQDKYITLLEQEITQLKAQTSIPKPVRRGWSEEDMQEARELKAQDKSAAQIGREIGRSASSVRSFFYYEDSRKGGVQ